MSFCIVPGCTNRKRNKNYEQLEKENRNNNISFHIFPKDIERKKKWLKALNLQNYSPPKTGAVCSEHFKEQNYNLESSLRKLKKDALPCLTEKKAVNNENNNSNIDHTEITIQHKNTKKATLIEENIYNDKIDTGTNENTDMEIEIDTELKYQHRSTSMSPERIFNSPIKNCLRKLHRNEIKKLKNQLYVSSYKIKKARKTIKSLQNILKDLQKRNLLTLQESDMLKHLDQGTKELIKREIRKRKKLPVSKKYKAALRQFALSLHFYSPKAYNYVRYKFYNSLPHPKTISRWYQSVHGEPGIITEALEAIKRRANSVSYKLVGTLIFDEIAIRQHVDYYKGKMVGYVDCGALIECDTALIAKEALVYCVTCMNDTWKMPIAYFLLNGINAERKKNLTLQCLQALHESGMLIISLTCDGLSTNLTMLQSLGCNFSFDSTHFQTSIKHPVSDNNIYVFMDPSHMLKLVRNTLGKVKELVDGDGNIIKWKHFAELHALQEAEGLHLANKIREKHMQYYKNKMKVSLATQLLSTSVSNALHFCKDTLQLPQFQDCSATIRFTSIFNDLFDIFNSKNLRQYGFKRPINEDNFLEISNKIKECAEYITKLSLIKGQNILHSRYKTGFLGFLCNIESMLHMYTFTCVKTNLLQYIPTYRISQDHIELFFSNIRFHGGYNNNPTVKQFKSAIQKLIIHTEIGDRNSTNCVPLQDIPILNVPSTQHPIKTINATTNSNQQWLDVFKTHHADHDYLPHAQLSFSTTEYKDEVISYIAGCILRKVKKLLHCIECIDALTAKTQTGCNFIDIKNRGSLLYPSKDLIYICKKVETAITIFKRTHTTLQSFKMDVFIYDVMENLIDKNIFIDLREHINDQCFFSNHINNLLRIIIQLYAKIRLTHDIQNVNISDRHKLNKLILFKGQ